MKKRPLRDGRRSTLSRRLTTLIVFSETGIPHTGRAYRAEDRSLMGEMSRTSGCICGAVELRMIGGPFAMTYCHCESCRPWIGAPVHASSLWPTQNVCIERGADQLVTFKRTDGSGSHRKFCRSCGSPVLIDHPTISMTDVPAGSVTDLVFEPSLHTHYTEKVLAMRDGLPKYKDFDPAVGGSGETVPE